jgi:hypothetical protein
MARLDERGAIYVEFLLAFPPLFLLFLGICQLCLVTTARLVVEHAAQRAVRTAIVVLEEEPGLHDNAERGALSGGLSASGTELEDLFAGLGLGPGSSTPAGLFETANRGSDSLEEGLQRGARMRPIRNAAYQPLLTLAPRREQRDGQDSLADGLPSDLARQLRHALGYTRAAAVVTLQQAPGSLELVDHVAPKALVTVRVSYLYRCSVPVVRALVCRSFSRLLEESLAVEGGGQRLVQLGKRFELAEDRQGLRELAGDSFFTVLEAEATLPNQSAAYYRAEEP